MFAEFAQGDPAAASIVTDLCKMVARPVAMLSTLLAPELVAICGLTGGLAASFIPVVQKETADSIEPAAGQTADAQ